MNYPDQSRPIWPWDKKVIFFMNCLFSLDVKKALRGRGGRYFS